MQTVSVPTLLYSIEALNLNKTEINSLDFTLNRALFKIFKISGSDNIKYCCTMYRIKSVQEIYNSRIQNFKYKLYFAENYTIKMITTAQFCL